MKMHTAGRRLAAGLAAATLTLVVTASAGAQPRSYVATLTGAQEVPPTGSPAIGTGLLTFDATAATLFVRLSFSGLTAPTGGAAPPAHLHAAAPGAAGPVIVPFAFVPAGITAGTFEQTLSLTTAQVASLTTNLAANAQGVTNVYFNVHTTAFPGGEIRGQVAVVPEPGTLALATGGLLALGAAVRRRRGSAR